MKIGRRQSEAEMPKCQVIFDPALSSNPLKYISEFLGQSLPLFLYHKTHTTARIMPVVKHGHFVLFSSRVNLEVIKKQCQNIGYLPSFHGKTYTNSKKIILFRKAIQVIFDPAFTIYFLIAFTTYSMCSAPIAGNSGKVTSLLPTYSVSGKCTAGDTSLL